jgi:uncharacterized LabA/DUF88 family protein
MITAFDLDPFMNIEKIALFIDGPNFRFSARALGLDVDFKRLLAEFERRGSLLRAYYYTTVVENAEFATVRPLIDWLDYNGYTVVTKPAKEFREFDDGEGRRKFKRNIAVELAVDALEVVARVDHIFLFSGDGDYRKLIEALQRRAVRVTVVSSVQTNPSMIAQELRRQADAFLDLADLRSSIERITPTPPERRKHLAADPVRQRG